MSGQRVERGKCFTCSGCGVPCSDPVAADIEMRGWVECQSCHTWFRNALEEINARLQAMQSFKPRVRP